MPGLPWKRSNSNAEPPVSSYLPTHPVDDTLLPEVEDEGFAGMFRDLPRPARVTAMVLPLLLLIFVGWGVTRLVSRAAAAARPEPEVALSEGRSITPSETGDATGAIVATMEPTR